jgi:hypothetical protein
VQHGSENMLSVEDGTTGPCTGATNAAYRGNAAAIIWHFHLAGA